MLDWCWQPDIWQVSLRRKNFSLCYGALHKHSLSFMVLLIPPPSDKHRRYSSPSAFNPGGNKRWLCVGWTLVVTGYHFSCPAFSRMSWVCFSDSLGCPACLPDWADMQELWEAASSTCAHLSQKWAGKKPWTSFQSLIFMQLGSVCLHSHCHPIHHTHTRSAELEQKLLCLCLPNWHNPPP